MYILLKVYMKILNNEEWAKCIYTYGICIEKGALVFVISEILVEQAFEPSERRERAIAGKVQGADPLELLVFSHSDTLFVHKFFMFDL